MESGVGAELSHGLAMSTLQNQEMDAEEISQRYMGSVAKFGQAETTYGE